MIHLCHLSLPFQKSCATHTLPSPRRYIKTFGPHHENLTAHLCQGVALLAQARGRVRQPPRLPLIHLKSHRQVSFTYHIREDHRCPHMGRRLSRVLPLWGIVILSPHGNSTKFLVITQKIRARYRIPAGAAVLAVQTILGELRRPQKARLMISTRKPRHVFKHPRSRTPFIH